MIINRLKTDVCVAGGGIAGVCAAIAASRNGARVVLCQDRPVLGGNASSEIRMHMCGADSLRGNPLEVEVREGGILEEIRLECAVHNPQCSASMLDLIMYDKCRSEQNITLLLNTAIHAVEMEGSAIRTTRALCSITEDEFEIQADYFIDCTGDGRLGAEAGAPYWMADDPSVYRGPYGDKRYTNCMGNSLLFTAKNMEKPMPFTAPGWARTFTEEQLAHRPHESWEYGYWWIEVGGEQNIIKDNGKICDELLAILFGVWDHIKNSGNHPESANWALDWFGFLPGKRESRRFVGLHTLNEEEMQDATLFNDTIAYGGWPMDMHPSRGIDAYDLTPCVATLTPYIYGIPLSSCISSEIDNLLFAGRNISVTRAVLSSTRIMATCAVVGEGVGTFASMCVGRGGSLKESCKDSSLLKATQQQLMRQDAYLPGCLFDNPSDCAKHAAVRASSQQEAGPAINVIDGYTRSTFGPGGCRPDQTAVGTHRWMSEPDDEQPWIELSWAEPVSFSRIVLIMDTGMHRRLSLTHQKDYMETMQWKAQEETLRDFTLLVDCGSGMEEVVSVNGHYQRRWQYEIELKNVHCLRLMVSATNGLDYARVFEVRCET